MIIRSRLALLPALVLLGACQTPFTIDGPPSMEVGTGEFEFRSVDPGEELEVVQGLQGGQHVWLGVSIENMNPNDLHLDLDIQFVETDEPHANPLFFDIDLFEGASGSWEYAGLPAQVKASEVDGHQLRLNVTATDKDGREAEGSMEITARRTDDG